MDPLSVLWHSLLRLTLSGSVLLLLLLGCSSDRNAEVVLKEKALVPEDTFSIRSGVVTLTNPDSLTVPFVNHGSPSMAYEQGMLFLRPDTVVSIRADSLMSIFIAVLGRHEQSFHFREGDTVAVWRQAKQIDEREVMFPMVSVTNREVNEYELNIDYYLHPRDVDPPVLAKKLTYDKRLDSVAVIHRLIIYYQTGLANLNELRMDGKLSPAAYQRQLNRLNALVEMVVYHRGSREAIEDKHVRLDSLRVPRINSIEDYDHRLVQLLVARLPIGPLPGKFSSGKLDSLMVLVHQNEGEWSTPLREDVQLALLRIQYNRDPIHVEEQLDLYATYFDEPDKRLRPFNRRLALDLQDFGVDELKLSSLTAPALLAFDGSETTFDRVLQESPTEYILLDFWATWCYACIRDAPAIGHLVDSLKGLDLGLLKLSIDANETDWRLYLTRKESAASYDNHYIVAEPRQSPFLLENEISTIPRYVLIDRDGRVLIDKIKGIYEDFDFVVGSVGKTIQMEEAR